MFFKGRENIVVLTRGEERLSDFERLSENLVRYLHIRGSWTLSHEYRHKTEHDMLSCDFDVQTCGLSCSA